MYLSRAVCCLYVNQYQALIRLLLVIFGANGNEKDKKAHITNNLYMESYWFNCIQWKTVKTVKNAWSFQLLHESVPCLLFLKFMKIRKTTGILSGVVKWVCKPTHTHTNPRGRLKWPYAVTRLIGLFFSLSLFLSLVAWCLIWWFACIE